MRAALIRPLAVIVALVVTFAHAQPIPRPEELRPWIDAGDPRAVPIILARLRAAAALSMHDGTDRFYMIGMIQHATMYQLDEAGPLMVALFERAEPNSSELEVVAYSAAQYRSEAAIGLQKAMLADARLENSELRVDLLAALAESSDAPVAEKAADALAEWTLGEFEQMAPDKAVSYAFLETVPTVRSKRFVDRINAIPMPPQPATDEAAADATRQKFKRRFLSRLQAKLALANGSPEEIIEAMAKVPASDEAMVDVALSTLARIAEPRHVAAIEAAQIGEGNVLAKSAHLATRRKSTVAAIKRRHWPHYAETQTTQPAAVEAAR